MDASQRPWSRYAVPLTFSLASVLLLAAYYLTSASGYDLGAHVIGRDFLTNHTGGVLINAGHWPVLFDTQAYWDTIKAEHEADYPIHLWSYPPLFWPISQAVGVFPYFAAYWLWLAGGVAMVWWATRVLGLPSLWWVLIVLSPAGFCNILAGQNGFYISSLMMVALHLTLSNRARLAGLSWAVIAVKPHLGICVLPMLIIQRRWNTVFWGAVCLAAFIAATISAYGLEPWHLFFTFTSEQQVHALETWQGLLLLMVPTGFMQGRLLGLETQASYLLHAAIALVSIVVLVLRWPGQNGDLTTWAIWLVCGTILLLPYSHVYDLVVWQFVLALWLTHKPLKRVPFQTLFVFILWGLPLISILIAQLTHIQITPLVLLIFLLFATWPELGVDSHPESA